MRLVQLIDEDDRRRVAVVSEDGASLNLLGEITSTYELAKQAIRSKLKLDALVSMKLAKGKLVVDYDKALSKGRILPPLDHPDPAHCLVTGTGLNHLGSAIARDAMHTKDAGKTPSDSMKMFESGARGGKPSGKEIGVAPEWFYKGDGSCIVPPGHPLEFPPFALDAGEEAEVVGLYVVSESGKVYRVGFALGNEYSDHVLERENYLYLAHSKLRDCSMGPELLLGELPDSVEGTVKLIRNGQAIWSGEFKTGEANMTHSIANMEHHVFKYRRFRRPGDVHCHFLGASVLSFNERVTPRSGDEFEICSATFGQTLRNPIGNREQPNTSRLSVPSL